jgi:hypothetical protein
LLSLVSILSHSLRLLGVLRGGKFLILSSTYLGGFQHLKRTQGSTDRVVIVFQRFSLPPKIRNFYEPWFGRFPSVFLITGHRSLFALWLTLQFSLILIQDPSCFASPQEKHCYSFLQNLFMWSNFP